MYIYIHPSMYLLLSLSPYYFSQPYLPLLPNVFFLRSHRTSAATDATTPISLNSRGPDRCTGGCMVPLGTRIGKTIPKVLLTLINRYISRGTAATTLDKSIESLCGTLGSSLRISCNLCRGELGLFGYIGFGDL